jgi:hypothetical protein
MYMCMCVIAPWILLGKIENCNKMTIFLHQNKHRNWINHQDKSPSRTTINTIIFEWIWRCFRCRWMKIITSWLEKKIIYLLRKIFSSKHTTTNVDLECVTTFNIPHSSNLISSSSSDIISNISFATRIFCRLDKS